MRRIMCFLLCLLLLPCALAEDGEYRGDGRTMLTVLTETALCREPGGEEWTQLPAEMRLITTGKTLLTGEDVAWYEVYLPESGYGFVEAACTEMDGGQLIAYRPGFGVSAGLFTVADPWQVRAEVVPAEMLEYPVVTLRRVSSVKQEDGSFLLVASFDTAGDVCKITHERVIATLYDLEGMPLAVTALEFYSPSCEQ